ncbi:hypothetical protein D3C81_2291450 [compost metagenome]
MAEQEGPDIGTDHLAWVATGQFVGDHAAHQFGPISALTQGRQLHHAGSNAIEQVFAKAAVFHQVGQ